MMMMLIISHRFVFLLSFIHAHLRFKRMQYSQPAAATSNSSSIPNAATVWRRPLRSIFVRRMSNQQQQQQRPSQCRARCVLIVRVIVMGGHGYRVENVLSVSRSLGSVFCYPFVLLMWCAWLFPLCMTVVGAHVGALASISDFHFHTKH